MTPPLDAVWDIECAEWDKFVVGAIWTRYDDKVHICRTEDDLAHALLGLERGATAWAHAGGRYDVLWLLDWCRRRAKIPDAQIRLSGSTIASLRIRGGPVLRDSCRLIPMALREAATMFPGCEQKQRLAFPCVCGENCGGYCSIAIDMPTHLRRALEEYLVADVLSLRDTLQKLFEYAAEKKLTLGGTVASSAWNTAKEICGLQDADWDFRSYKHTRLGYYGGRVQVGKMRAPRVYRFDRASAYPAALKKSVPTGERRLLTEKNASLAWKRDKPGVYEAVLDIPEMMAPPLPMRHGNRLVYPWGIVRGSWPRDEIRNAVDCGAKILRITGGVAWADEKPLVRPYVEYLFKLRSEAESKSLKGWIKFMLNSPTGAFAQEPEQDIVSLGEQYADDPRYEQVGRYDWIWRRKTFHISSRAHVEWASCLTGDARVELHAQICHAGDDWCYSDTDSDIASRMLTRNVGTELGQWVYEGWGKDFVALAPKIYSYLHPGGAGIGIGPDDFIGPLIRFAKAKGIPDAVAHWDQIASGEKVKIDRGVKTMMVAARGPELFDRQNTSRQLNKRIGWIGDRIIDNERTRAPHVNDLKNLPK